MKFTVAELLQAGKNVWVLDDAAITLFYIISFFETVFEIYLSVALIGAFTPISPKEHQRTLKELYESDLFKDNKGQQK